MKRYEKVTKDEAQRRKTPRRCKRGLEPTAEVQPAQQINCI